MNISSESFQQIVAALRSDSKRPNSRDKRNLPRVGVRGRATIIPCSAAKGRKAMAVTIRDISRGGLCFLQNEPMDENSEFILYLHGSSTSETRAILCAVTRWQVLDNNLYAIGARFSREVSASGDKRGAAMDIHLNSAR